MPQQTEYTTHCSILTPALTAVSTLHVLLNSLSVISIMLWQKFQVI